jgi:N-acylglucosamine-6-phosphate 2-epimerase
MKKDEILAMIKGGLIVSSQALEDEPLHSSYIMSKMALAAKLGGAVGIRANSGIDIKAIKMEVNLPLIGIVKSIYEDSEVFITPTLKEVDEIVEAGAEIIATDGTHRTRPGGKSLEEFYKEVRKKYPDIMLMADIATFDEGVRASELGFDLIGTTLCGYTSYTRDVVIPNFELLKELACKLDVPIIAEGGIWTPEHLRKAIETGAHAAVVGTAITRPRDITKRFVKELNLLKK